MSSSKKQSLTLAVNLAGLEQDSTKDFFDSLDKALETFVKASKTPVDLIFATLKNDAKMRHEFEIRYGRKARLHQIITAVPSNISVILNRLLKYCFVDLQSSSCLLLQPDSVIHVNSLVQAFEQWRRTPEAVIGSRLLHRTTCDSSGNQTVAIAQSNQDCLTEYNLYLPEQIYRKIGGLDCTLDFKSAVKALILKLDDCGIRFVRLDPRAGLGSISTNSRLVRPASSLSKDNYEHKLRLASENNNLQQSLVREFHIVRDELDEIQHTLRTLTLGFRGVSTAISKLPVDGLKTLFGAPYRLPWVHNTLALIATLFAWLYFRVRLPKLFDFITCDNPINGNNSAFGEYEEDLKTLSESGLFDTYYYLSQAPEANDHPLGPVGHYLQCGWHLSPHRLFDPVYYHSVNELDPDASSKAPLLSYLKTTGSEAFSPHPLFDAVYYVHSRKDLSESAATFNPLQHYVSKGAQERHDPHPLFFTSYYITRYSHEIGPKLTPLEHFVMRGHTGTYSPNPVFDSAYYLRNQPGLKNTLTNPLVHYILSGRWDKAKTHPLFDSQYYIRQLPADEVVDGDPLTHFLHADVAKMLSPTPLFDPEFYAERTPYVHEAGLNAFSHYLSDGEPMGLDPCPMFHTRWFRARHIDDLSYFYASSLGYYAEIAEARGDAPHPFFCPKQYRALHPEIGAGSALAHYNQNKPEILPLINYLDKVPDTETRTSLDQAFANLLAATAEPFTHLILMPGLVHGGAERAACNYIKYLQNLHGKSNILILFSIYQDHTAIDWLPEGSRVVDILKLATETFEDTGLLQAGLILTKSPPVVHCLNAYNFKMAMARYRPVLEQASRYLIYLFGYEAYTQAPNELSNNLMQGSAGWADCIVTDSQKLVELVLDEMPERRSQHKKRLTICCYNAAPGVENRSDLIAESARQSGRKVLWASRLVESKRPDLLVKIARRLPDIEFVVYGSSETANMVKIDPILKDMAETPNITYFGEYPSFSAIDKKDIGLFCYTSESDGIPMVLLEAATSGLPIAAPNVGGIPEFITPETGWLINRYDDVEGYAKAILEAFSNKPLARQKARCAQIRLVERHSLDSLARRLNQFAEFF